MKEVVCFSYRPVELSGGRNLSGREQLFAKLQRDGLQPVVSLGAEQAFQGDSITVHRLIAEQKSAYLGARAVSSIGLILNRLDRSFKKEQIPAAVQLPPIINENATRSLGFRKQRMHDEVLAPLGIAIPTALPPDKEALGAFLESTPAPRYMVKPNSGSNSKGLVTVTRDSAQVRFEETPELYGSHVIQPKHDFSIAFPASLRPYDRASAEAFNGWNREGITKELRYYGFHSPSDTAVFPIARAIDDAGDHWFFIDPQSVPAAMTAKTVAVMRKTAEVSAAWAVYGAIDWGYGTPDEAEPGWSAIEGNIKAPYLLGYDKHPNIADHLRELMAAQILQTVEAQS